MLDVGCGRGSVLPVAEARPLTATDLTPATAAFTARDVARAGLQAIVTDAGLMAPTVAKYRDETMGSHGGRELLRHLPSNRIEAASVDAAQALASVRNTGGELSLTDAVRITITGFGPGKGTR
ncbi:hypothetical protein [Micromonospora sp. SH-82]|uniref:hypothetical protein n=1 Tax=Micromonospora sp. SH-82 TaxID=3132938 RepID=UPI003EB8CFB4